MSEYAKYMDDAWRLHKNATLDLNRWRETNGENGELRVIAETAWEAVSLAACVLLESRGVQPPPERRARRYALYYMEKEHSDLSAVSITARLVSMETTLHQDCFYDAQCPPNEIIRNVTEDAREFLEYVAKLSNANGAKPAASDEANGG